MKNLMNFLIGLCFLAVSGSAFSDWVEGYVEEIEVQLGSLESGGDFSLPSYVQPSQLLPLSPLNNWTYIATDVFAGTSQGVEAYLGEQENIGYICLQPLVFANEELVLYLQNLNDRIILHGFRIRLSSGEFSLFFREGGVSSLESGIILASNDVLIDLEQEQSGNQKQELNGETVTFRWKVTNKRYQVIDSLKSYAGESGGSDKVESPEKTSELKFYLYINDSYIATLELHFLPGIGLSQLTFQGDHPGFGGQFHYIYELPNSPQKSFFLASQINEIVDYSCLGALDYDDLARTNAGLLANWFNILILIVVVLEGLNSNKVRVRRVIACLPM